jgi:hypothetical protein
MAKSASTVYGFSLERSLLSVENPTLLDYIIKDSSTVTIGDPARFSTDGHVKRSAAGEAILGIIMGIVDKDGLNVFSPRAQGTIGSTLTPDDTVAVSSTNSSDATRYVKVQVALDPAGVLLWRNDTDGTLTASNLGQLFDVGATVGQIATGTASDSNGQFQLVKIDESDTTIGYFRIVESQLAVGIDQGTAKVTA